MIVVASTSPAIADTESTLVLFQNNVRVPPGASSYAFTYDCEFELPESFGGLTLNISGNDQGSISIAFKTEYPATWEERLADAVMNDLGVADSPIPCVLGSSETLTKISGSGSLNSSIPVGTIFGPPLSLKREAIGTLDFNDTIDITSAQALALEMPVSISGAVFASEFGGNVASTKGTAKLAMSGNIGTFAFSEQVMVESVSAPTEERTINVTRVAPISVGSGVTGIPVFVHSEVRVEATAVTQSLLGAGAVAGADFPNSIRVGLLRAAGGGPLPPGITVRLRSNGLVIQSTVPPCPADFNDSGTLSVQDIFDFLAAYFSGDPRADFNASGGISVQDIFDYLAAYFAGCP